MAANTPASQPRLAADGQQTPVSATTDIKMEDVEAKEEDGADGNGKSTKNPADDLSNPRRLLDLATQEPRIPVKKDATLREFMGKMDDYAPIIPDAVVNYYLTLAGLPPPPQTPPHLARLLALATQKFVADIAADAYQYARIRSSTASGNNPISNMAGAVGGAAGAAPGVAGAAGGAGGKDGGQTGKSQNLGVQRPGFGGGGQGGTQGRSVLTMEDLGMAVGEYGVNLKRGEFYR